MRSERILAPRWARLRDEDGPAGDIELLDVLRARLDDIARHLVDWEAAKLEGGPGVAATVEKFVAGSARFFPFVTGEAAFAIVERFTSLRSCSKYCLS